MNTTIIAVGERMPGWHPGIEQGVIWNFTDMGHTLMYMFHAPTPTEIESFAGPVEFALYADAPIVALLARIAGWPWQTTFFNAHLYDQEDRMWPSLPEKGTGAAMTMLLIDANDGVVTAMRVLALGNDFTRAVHQAIRTQMRGPFDREAYTARVRKLDDPQVHPVIVARRLLSQAVARWKTRD